MTTVKPDHIAAIIDPQAMSLAHKLGRRDLKLTEEMQNRILSARARAADIVALYRKVVDAKGDGK
jgi:hypothetical protein